MGLDVLNSTASAALQTSANTMAAVITAIKALNVTDDEFATQALTVSEQYTSVYNSTSTLYEEVF